jgi:hypothetical protein
VKVPNYSGSCRLIRHDGNFLDSDLISDVQQGASRVRETLLAEKRQCFPEIPRGMCDNCIGNGISANAWFALKERPVALRANSRCKLPKARISVATQEGAVGRVTVGVA